MLGHFSNYHWEREETFKVCGAGIAVFIIGTVFHTTGESGIAHLSQCHIPVAPRIFKIGARVIVGTSVFAASFQIPFVQCLPVEHLLLIWNDLVT